MKKYEKQWVFAICNLVWISEGKGTSTGTHSQRWFSDTYNSCVLDQHLLLLLYCCYLPVYSHICFSAYPYLVYKANLSSIFSLTLSRMLSATVDRYLEVIFNHFSFYLVPITRCWIPKALTIIPFDYYLCNSFSPLCISSKWQKKEETSGIIVK